MTDKNWTTANIPDLTGKVLIVTGGNSGLGYESVKAFADHGGEVVLACRSMEKGEDAKKNMGILKGRVVVMALDLMDLSSIQKFAIDFKSKYKRLDVLLNNAGIMTTPFGLTRDGFESQLGTNHLGHFALTGWLLDLIVKTPGSRVVNVSSLAHKQGHMDFDNLLYEGAKGYSRIGAYSRSKLANLLFTYELQRFFEGNSLESIAIAAHPGLSNTNLFRHLEKYWMIGQLSPLFTRFTQGADAGALPEIRAAVDPEVKGGEYYGPDGFREMKGFPVLVQSNKASHSREDARKLWEVSEKLTGVRFRV